MAQSSQSVLNIPVSLNTSQAERDMEKLAQRAQLQFARAFSKGNAASFPLGRMSKDASEFESSLKAASARVLAFGATAGVIYNVSRAMQSLVTNTIEWNRALTEIKSFTNLARTELVRFGNDLVQVAKNTGQSFKDVASGALELSRQGLSASETIKRLSDASILARQSGLSLEESVSAITASVNSFNKSMLTSTEIINKFAAVDAAFAVSSKDLAQGIARSGSSAQEAGISINELISLVATLQQQSQRGGAVIGNALKTIFARIARPEVLDQLSEAGVALRNLDGSAKSTIQVFQDFARVFTTASDAQRSHLAELVGSTYQVNLLKGLLADLSSSYNSFEKGVQLAANAQDDAIRRNQEYNESLSAILNSMKLSIQQFSVGIGSNLVEPVVKNINSIFKDAGKLADETGLAQFGSTIGAGLLKGLSSYISGPGIIVLFEVFRRLSVNLAGFVKDSTSGFLQLQEATKSQAVLQKELLGVLAAQPNLQQKVLAGKISEVNLEKELLSLVEQRLLIASRLESASNKAAGGLLGRGVLAVNTQTGAISSPKTQRVPNFSNPLSEAIEREKASGVPVSTIRIGQSPSLKSPQNPLGLGVYNTIDEPMGLKQGIQRSKEMGIDPKRHGIPSFATGIYKRTQAISNPQAENIALEALAHELGRSLAQQSISQQQFEAQLKDLAATSKLTTESLKLLEKEAQWAAKKYQEQFGRGKINTFFNSQTQPYFPYAPARLQQQNNPATFNQLSLAPDLAVLGPSGVQEKKNARQALERILRPVSDGISQSLSTFEKDLANRMRSWEQKMGLSLPKGQYDANKYQATFNKAGYSQMSLFDEPPARRRSLGQMALPGMLSDESLQLMNVLKQNYTKMDASNHPSAKFRTVDLNVTAARQEELKQRYIGSAGTFSSYLPWTQAGRDARTLGRLSPTELKSARLGLAERYSSQAMALSFVAPMLGGVAQESFGDSTRMRRGFGQTAAGLGNIASYAATGFFLGKGLPGAAIGAVGGSLLELPKIFKAFSDELPDIQRRMEQLRESASKTSENLRKYIETQKNLDDIYSGRTQVTKKTLTRIEQEKNTAFSQLTVDQQDRILSAFRKGGSAVQDTLLEVDEENRQKQLREKLNEQINLLNKSISPTLFSSKLRTSANQPIDTSNFLVQKDLITGNTAKTGQKPRIEITYKSFDTDQQKQIAEFVSTLINLRGNNNNTLLDVFGKSTNYSSQYDEVVKELNEGRTGAFERFLRGSLGSIGAGNGQISSLLSVIPQNSESSVLFAREIMKNFTPEKVENAQNANEIQRQYVQRREKELENFASALRNVNTLLNQFGTTIQSNNRLVTEREAGISARQSITADNFINYAENFAGPRTIASLRNESTLMEIEREYQAQINVAMRENVEGLAQAVASSLNTYSQKVYSESFDMGDKVYDLTERRRGTIGFMDQIGATEFLANLREGEPDALAAFQRRIEERLSVFDSLGGGLLPDQREQQSTLLELQNNLKKIADETSTRFQSLGIQAENARNQQAERQKFLDFELATQRRITKGGGIDNLLGGNLDIATILSDARTKMRIGGAISSDLTKAEGAYSFASLLDSFGVEDVRTKFPELMDSIREGLRYQFGQLKDFDKTPADEIERTIETIINNRFKSEDARDSYLEEMKQLVAATKAEKETMEKFFANANNASQGIYVRIAQEGAKANEVTKIAKQSLNFGLLDYFAEPNVSNQFNAQTFGQTKVSNILAYLDEAEKAGLTYNNLALDPASLRERASRELGNEAFFNSLNSVSYTNTMANPTDLRSRANANPLLWDKFGMSYTNIMADPATLRQRANTQVTQERQTEAFYNALNNQSYTNVMADPASLRARAQAMEAKSPYVSSEDVIKNYFKAQDSLGLSVGPSPEAIRGQTQNIDRIQQNAERFQEKAFRALENIQLGDLTTLQTGFNTSPVSQFWKVRENPASIQTQIERIVAGLESKNKFYNSSDLAGGIRSSIGSDNLAGANLFTSRQIGQNLALKATEMGATMEQVAKSLDEYEKAIRNSLGKTPGKALLSNEYAANRELARLAYGQYNTGDMSGEEYRQYKQSYFQSRINAGERNYGDAIEAFRDEFRYNSKDFFQDTVAGAQEVGRTMKTSFADAFNSFAMGARNAKEAFRDFGMSVLNRISEILTTMATNTLFNGLGNVLGSVAPGLTNAFSQRTGYSSGGLVRGGSGMRDDVPATLSNGDFVIRKSAVDKYGEDTLSAINNGDPKSVKQTLANRYAMDSETRPYNGWYNVDPRLSAYAQTDENNPMNELKLRRESDLTSYLKGYEDYLKYKEELEDNFERAKEQRRTAGYIQAGVTIAGAAVNAAAQSYANRNSETVQPPTYENGETPSSFEANGNTYFRNEYPDGTVTYSRVNNASLGRFSNANIGPRLPRASGGSVYGNSRDNVPVMLTGGEYVIREQAVKKFGTNFLNRLNRGEINPKAIKGYAEGGLVTEGSYTPTIARQESNEELVAVLERLAQAAEDMTAKNNVSTKSENRQENARQAEAAPVYNINITTTVQSNGEVKSDSKVDATSANKQNNAQAVLYSELFKTMVIKIITDQQRQGGVLYGTSSKG